MKTKTGFRKFLSLVLCCAMLLSFNVPAFAEGEECSHASYVDGACASCGAVCSHEGFITETPSTCTTAGSKVIACTVCGVNSTEELPLAKHSFVDGVCNAENCGFVCTHASYVDGVCSVCGVDEPAPECSHNWAEGVCTLCSTACTHEGFVTETPSTCTTAGSKVIACTVCGLNSSEELPLAKHNFVEGVCSAENCGFVCTHTSYVEGLCADCGAAQPAVAADCTLNTGCTLGADHSGSCKNDAGAYLVSTKAQFDAAYGEAGAGSTIMLTADIDYTGTASLTIDKAITIDLNGKTLTTHGTYGGLLLKNNCSLISSAAERGTLAHQATVAAIKAWNVTEISNVDITVAFVAEDKIIGGIVIQSDAGACVGSISNVSISGPGLTNGIETYGNCGNSSGSVIGSMGGVSIDARGTGMIISAPVGTVSGCSIHGDSVGIEFYIKGTYSAKMNLSGSTVSGASAMKIHDEYSSGDIQNVGALQLTESGNTINGAVTVDIARAENGVFTVENGTLAAGLEAGTAAKIGNTYYSDLGKAAEAANAGDTITLLKDTDESLTLPLGVLLDTNDKKADNIVTVPVVAKIGESVFASLQEAVAAVTGDCTIELLADAQISDTLKLGFNAAADKANVTINGNGHSITATGDTWDTSKWFADITWHVTINDLTFDSNEKGSRGVQFYTSDSSLNNVTFKNFNGQIWSGYTDMVVQINASDVSFSGVSLVNCRLGHVILDIGSNTGRTETDLAVSGELPGATVILNNPAAELTASEGSLTVVKGTDGSITDHVMVYDNGSYKMIIPVAKVGEKYYDSLQAALDDCELAAEENIVIDLVGDATLDITAWETLAIGADNTKTITINGNGNKLTFNQLNTDWNHVATKNNAKLILNDMTIANSGCNDGPWNRYDINFACPVELNDVTSERAMAFKSDAALNGVTVNESGNVYAVWVQSNGQTVSIDDLTVNCPNGRGIKIDEEYVSSPGKVDLDISSSSFTTANKAAILVKSAAGADIAVDNVNIDNVAADSTNAVWVDEDGSGSYGAVEVKGANKAQENAAAMKVEVYSGDVLQGYHKKLDAAVKAAQDGYTVVLLESISVTDSVVIDKDITLDLNGKTLSAESTLSSKPVIRVLGNVTVTNGTVDGTSGINSYAVIVGNTDTAGTVNIADGTFKGITSAISITNGTANISGGTFSTGHDNEGTDYGAHYLLNCMDDAYKAGKAVYNITGGTFVGFDPADNASEGSGTSFVAEDYATEKSGDNYIVKPVVRVTYENKTLVTGNAQPEYTYTSNAVAEQIIEDGYEVIVTTSAITLEENKTEYDITGSVVIKKDGSQVSDFITAVVPAKLTVSGAAAKINDTYYATLAEAQAAAEDGDKITVLKLSDEEKAIVIDGSDIGYVELALPADASGISLTVKNEAVVKISPTDLAKLSGGMKLEFGAAQVGNNVLGMEDGVLKSNAAGDLTATPSTVANGEKAMVGVNEHAIYFENSNAASAVSVPVSAEGDVTVPAGSEVEFANGAKVEVDNEAVISGGTLKLVPNEVKTNGYGMVVITEGTGTAEKSTGILVPVNTKNNKCYEVSIKLNADGKLEVSSEAPEELISDEGADGKKYLTIGPEKKSFYKYGIATLKFEANGFLDCLDKVLVDGKEINSDNYTLKRGSTIITLKNSYLKNLALGNHTLTLEYKDGESISATISVVSTPITGDSGIAPFACIMALSSIAMLALLIVLKKKSRA